MRHCCEFCNISFSSAPGIVCGYCSGIFCCDKCKEINFKTKRAIQISENDFMNVSEYYTKEYCDEFHRSIELVD